MRTQLYIDGELRTVDIKDGRITTVNEEPTQPKTGWERVNVGETYFTLTQYKPHEQGEDNDANDQKMYDSANYFSDGKIAADVFRAQTIWRKLLRWQAENDNPAPENRYCIWFDNYEGIPKIKPYFSSNCDKYPFGIKFSSSQAAQEAIKIFYDELMWYFTKFNPRLDGGVE